MARSGLSGSPGFGENSNSTESNPFGRGSSERAEFRFKFRLAKSEIAKVAPDIFRKLWCSFCAQFAQRFTRAVHLRANILDFFRQTLQLGVSAFDLAHPFRRALAKRDHFGD